MCFLQETILEEQHEDGDLAKESTDLTAEPSFDSEEKNARRGKVTKKVNQCCAT